MLPEISLNILDVAENSVRANATLIKITVSIHNAEDTLIVTIEDNGCGMTKDQIQNVTDPFFTTRTTRKVGLGVPFFKQAAESTGGQFIITSEVSVGTLVKAEFCLSHIDRMPLGDMTSTIYTLVTMHETIDFIYTYQFNNDYFTLDTREFRAILGDISFRSKDVSSYIREYLNENKDAVDGGCIV